MAAAKTYPLLRAASLAAAGLAAFATVQFVRQAISQTGFLGLLAVAVVLVLLALLFARRVPQGAAAARHGSATGLSGRSREQLQAALVALEQEHRAGQLSAERHRRARERIEAELARR